MSVLDKVDINRYYILIYIKCTCVLIQYINNNEQKTKQKKKVKFYKKFEFFDENVAKTIINKTKL